MIYSLFIFTPEDQLQDIMQSFFKIFNPFGAD